MSKITLTKIEIELTPSILKRWNGYCGYNQKSHAEMIEEIVKQWDANNQMKAQVIQAELNGELDDLHENI